MLFRGKIELVMCRRAAGCGESKQRKQMRWGKEPPECKQLSVISKLSIYKTAIWTMALYGCETWALIKSMRRR